ncbi:unnamed protein product [Parnassius apollo]|uniref:(apollo) hypothetical protein n=1 Tax=Parnassius apollo TaxID=110799 RepID=A0A8S3XRQ7_PARAO|nr:unnamed protein product [Parnassius apollo]
MPIVSSKKVVSVPSKQTHKITTNCGEEEDIIEVEMVSDNGQEKEKQERVEEIYSATFKCREKDKEKIGKEVSGEIIGSEEKKEQDKGYEINGAAFDSIKLIPLDKDLLFDLNNIEEICDNLEVLDETGVNFDDSKHKITNRKRNCIQEEKWEIKAQKIPKLNTEKKIFFQ